LHVHLLVFEEEIVFTLLIFRVNFDISIETVKLWDLASSSSLSSFAVSFSELAVLISGSNSAIITSVLVKVTFLIFLLRASGLAFVLSHTSGSGLLAFWWHNSPVAFISLFFFLALLLALIIWDTSWLWLRLVAGSTLTRVSIALRSGDILASLCAISLKLFAVWIFGHITVFTFTVSWVAFYFWLVAN